MSTVTVSRILEIPIELSRLSAIRIHGEEGPTPVDPASAHVVVTGSQSWIVWERAGITRAVNYRHIVEFISDEFELAQSGT